MKKKKIKKLVKKLLKKQAKKSPPASVVPLLFTVKAKLEAMKKPAWIRSLKEEKSPTVEEYRKLDPLSDSTMRGEFTGRTVGRLHCP